MPPLERDTGQKLGLILASSGAAQVIQAQAWLGPCPRPPSSCLLRGSRLALASKPGLKKPRDREGSRRLEILAAWA